MDKQLENELAEYETSYNSAEPLHVVYERLQGNYKFTSQSFDSYMLERIRRDFPWLEIEYKKKYNPESVN